MAAISSICWLKKWQKWQKIKKNKTNNEKRLIFSQLPACDILCDFFNGLLLFWFPCETFISRNPFIRFNTLSICKIHCFYFASVRFVLQRFLQWSLKIKFNRSFFGTSCWVYSYWWRSKEMNVYSARLARFYSKIYRTI